MGEDHVDFMYVFKHGFPFPDLHTIQPLPDVFNGVLNQAGR